MGLQLMAIIEPSTNESYPTLPFKVQAASYAVTNSNDFTVTNYNGAPSRLKTSFLNGWKAVKMRIFFANAFEAEAWSVFYRTAYDGTTGGLQNGVSPFFAEIELGGIFGKRLCQLSDAEWSTGTYKGQSYVLTLTCEVSPKSYQEDQAARDEIIASLLAAGVPANKIKYNIYGLWHLTELDMDPVNVWK